MITETTNHNDVGDETLSNGPSLGRGSKKRRLGRIGVKTEVDEEILEQVGSMSSKIVKMMDSFCSNASKVPPGLSLDDV